MQDLQDEAWPDLGGRIEADEAGSVHRLPIRVYFEDTDFSGVVYHASYVRWCERGRSDFLRLLGNNHDALFQGVDGHEPAFFVVRRITCDFLKPARMDDVLMVETRAGEVGSASLVVHQHIKRGGRTICEAEMTLVLISSSGKPQRISQRLRTALSVKVP